MRGVRTIRGATLSTLDSAWAQLVSEAPRDKTLTVTRWRTGDYQISCDLPNRREALGIGRTFLQAIDEFRRDLAGKWEAPIDQP